MSGGGRSAQQDREFPYVKGLLRGVEVYRDLIEGQPTVIMGDFNSNAIWNRKRAGAQDHGALVTRLDELGLVSAYHDFHDEAHGAETRPTLYFLRKESRPYHIDYCFIPKTWASHVRAVDVGSYAEWTGASDHRPVVVDLEEPGNA